MDTNLSVPDEALAPLIWDSAKKLPVLILTSLIRENAEIGNGRRFIYRQIINPSCNSNAEKYEISHERVLQDYLFLRQRDICDFLCEKEVIVTGSTVQYLFTEEAVLGDLIDETFFNEQDGDLDEIGFELTTSTYSRISLNEVMDSGISVL